MKILAIANAIPMRDRSAGAFRFASILELLAAHHEVQLHPWDVAWQERHFGRAVVAPYRSALSDRAVQVTDGSGAQLTALLRSRPFDVVFIEHYRSARPRLIDKIRLMQPNARVLVDTVDVAFNRLSIKADVSGLDEDRLEAARVKAEELAAYGRGDLVIAVSATDAAVLRAADPSLRIDVIPLIYRVPPLADQPPRLQRREVMFVADFNHDANVDGIDHFCREVLPWVVQQVPGVRLRVVGASPPEAVLALAGPNVEVLGFVPDLEAIYRTSDVAIAPMRYGGGLKGKIAEAMAHGVPVVTNTVSLTGFSATPGDDVVVGDDPQAFARGVVALLRDDELYARVKANGWRFVNANYSREGVGRMLDELMAGVPSLPVKRLPLARRAAHAAQTTIERHVAWRFR